MDEEGLLSQDDINAALSEAGLDVPGLTENAGDSSATASPGAAAADTRLDSAGRPFDEVAAAMAEAIANEKADAAASVGTADPMGEAMLLSGAMPFDIPELQSRPNSASLTEGIDLLRDVQLDVKIELGRSRMLVDDVLRLGEGSVVELDKLAGDPVDVYVNDRLVAHGEVLVLNDNFCVRINDIVRQEGDDDNTN